MKRKRALSLSKRPQRKAVPPLLSQDGVRSGRKSIIGASDRAATVAKAVWEQLADLHANTSGCRPPPLAGSGVGSHGQQVLVLLERELDLVPGR